MINPYVFNMERSTYGYLYNWYAVSDANFAHIGMRVPTIVDYNTLASSVTDGRDLKEGGLVHWDAPNTGPSNSSGFTAFGGGVRDGVDGGFVLIKDWAYLATSDDGGVDCIDRILRKDSNTFGTTNSSKKSGVSVRLVSDSNPGVTIIDYDGNVYDVVQIGTQYWTVQNWKCIHLNEGTALTNVTGDVAWAALTTEGYCAYDNNNDFV